MINFTKKHESEEYCNLGMRHSDGEHTKSRIINSH